MSTFAAMSGALATIFALEKSRKWIIRDGVTGISRSGSGAPIASGFRKARGSRKGDASREVGGKGASVRGTYRARARRRVQEGGVVYAPLRCLEHSTPLAAVPNTRNGMRSVMMRRASCHSRRPSG